MNLEPGDHIIRMVINGKKDEKSTGTRLKVVKAIVYNEI
jgi:hypothetical protein